MTTPDSRPVLDVIAWAFHRACGCDGTCPPDDEDWQGAAAVLAACQGATVEQKAQLVNGRVEEIDRIEWYDTGKPDLSRILGNPGGNVMDVRLVPSARVVTEWAARS